MQTRGDLKWGGEVGRGGGGGRCLSPLALSSERGGGEK